jgi:hypothetical protein
MQSIADTAVFCAGLGLARDWRFFARNFLATARLIASGAPGGRGANDILARNAGGMLGKPRIAALGNGAWGQRSQMTAGRFQHKSIVHQSTRRATSRSLDFRGKSAPALLSRRRILIGKHGSTARRSDAICTCALQLGLHLQAQRVATTINVQARHSPVLARMRKPESRSLFDV